MHLFRKMYSQYGEECAIISGIYRQSHWQVHRRCRRDLGLSALEYIYIYIYRMAFMHWTTEAMVS